MLTVFDSATIAVPERVAAFRDIVAATLAPTSVDSPDPEAFTARLRAMSLGNAQITSLAYTSLTARRSPRDIRRSDPEYCQVGLILGGRQGVAQSGASAVLRRGDLVIYDSSRPLEAVNVSGPAPAESIVLQVSKKMLPLSEGQMASLCAVSLPGTAGIGRVLATFLASLADGRTRCTERDALRLETVAVDLTTAVLAHHLERDNAPLRSATHTLYLRIIAFIEDNLHHPDLRPATLDHLTIATIARRWGFARPADFSRAFQRHTGTPPRDYRYNT